MKTQTLTHRDRLEIVTVAILGLSVLLVGWHFGVSQKWLGGAGVTVIAFGLAIGSFRSSWQESWFWKWLCGLFLIHCLLVWLLLAVVLKGRNKLNLPAMGSAGVVETILVTGILQTQRGRRARARHN